MITMDVYPPDMDDEPTTELPDEAPVEPPPISGPFATIAAGLAAEEDRREVCPCDGCLFGGSCQNLPAVLDPARAASRGSVRHYDPGMLVTADHEAPIRAEARAEILRMLREPLDVYARAAKRSRLVGNVAVARHLELFVEELQRAVELVSAG